MTFWRAARSSEVSSKVLVSIVSPALFFMVTSIISLARSSHTAWYSSAYSHLTRTVKARLSAHSAE